MALIESILRTTDDTGVKLPIHQVLAYLREVRRGVMTAVQASAELALDTDSATEFAAIAANLTIDLSRLFDTLVIAERSRRYPNARYRTARDVRTANNIPALLPE